MNTVTTVTNRPVVMSQPGLEIPVVGTVEQSNQSVPQVTTPQVSTPHDGPVTEPKSLEGRVDAVPSAAEIKPLEGQSEPKPLDGRVEPVEIKKTITEPVEVKASEPATTNKAFVNNTAANVVVNAANNQLVKYDVANMDAAKNGVGKALYGTEAAPVEEAAQKPSSEVTTTSLKGVGALRTVAGLTRMAMGISLLNPIGSFLKSFAGEDSFLLNTSSRLAGAAGAVSNVVTSFAFRTVDVFCNNAYDARTNIRDTTKAIMQNPGAFGAKVLAPKAAGFQAGSSLVTGYAYFYTQQKVSEQAYAALGGAPLPEMAKQVAAGASGCLAGTVATSTLGAPAWLYNLGEHYVHPPAGETRASSAAILRASVTPRVLGSAVLRQTVRHAPAAVGYAGLAVLFNNGTFNGATASNQEKE